jgi:hypothetical protein
VRRRVWALESKCVMLTLLRRLVCSSRDLCLQSSLNEIMTEVFDVPGVL